MYIDHLSQTLVFETKNVDDLFEQGLWCLKIEMLIYIKKWTNLRQHLEFENKDVDILYVVPLFYPTLFYPTLIIPHPILPHLDITPPWLYPTLDFTPTFILPHHILYHTFYNTPPYFTPPSTIPHPILNHLYSKLRTPNHGLVYQFRRQS